MKKQLVHFASSALLGIGLAMAGTSAATAASPLIAGTMAGPAKAAAGTAGGVPGMVRIVERDDYYKRPNPYAEPGDFDYYESSKNVRPRNRVFRNHNYRHRKYRNHNRNSGVYFNFGGRGGGFSFGVTPPPQYRYYERPRHHRRDYRRSNATPHVSWCHTRYRSYRQWDNTFQPYHGPRKQCISPYYR